MRSNLSIMLRRNVATLMVVAVMGIGGRSFGGFTDSDPNTPGVQSGSWTEPHKLWITIPAGLAGANRMMFEMGVSSWQACLTKITICFRNPGDAAPPGGDGLIPVNLVAAGSIPGGELGSTAIGVNTPANNGHGSIASGSIDLDMGALGFGNLLKNLGAHEFGHALGLDDAAHPASGRVDVMDPKFDQNSPVLTPSAADKMMLMEHYMVPAPGGAAVLAMGGIVCGRRRR